MRRAMIIAALAMLGLGGAARAQEVKHFKTWIAACDNLRTCAAYGFSPEDGDNEGYLKLSRGGAAGDPPLITLQDVDQDPPTGPVTWRIAVDGASPTGLAAIATKATDNGPRAQLTASQSAALVAALRDGSVLTLTSGKSVLTISLAGAVASLLWIDDRQGRAGTVAALAAKGAKATASSPIAPPAVRMAALVAPARLPAKLPAALKARPEMKDCDADPGFDPLVARLGPGTLLWAAPCSSGAYNELFEVFVAGEAGERAQHILLPEAIKASSGGDGEVMNLGYDPKTGVLSAFAKARGLGDCGEIQSWVWDGQAFRLIDESIMPDCRAVGPDDWPSVYHARPIRPAR